MDRFTVWTDGGVDVEASTREYAAKLSEWVKTKLVPTDKISDAVEAVFDAHAEALPMGALSLLVAQRLEATPQQLARVAEQVSQYLKANPLRFKIAKGTRGGCMRLTERSEKAAA